MPEAKIFCPSIYIKAAEERIGVELTDLVDDNGYPTSAVEVLGTDLFLRMCRIGEKVYEGQGEATRETVKARKALDSVLERDPDLLREAPSQHEAPNLTIQQQKQSSSVIENNPPAPHWSKQSGKRATHFSQAVRERQMANAPFRGPGKYSRVNDVLRQKVQQQESTQKK